MKKIQRLKQTEIQIVSDEEVSIAISCVAAQNVEGLQLTERVNPNFFSTGKVFFNFCYLRFSHTPPI